MSGNITGQGCLPSQTCVQINTRGGSGQGGSGVDTQNTEDFSGSHEAQAKQTRRVAILPVRYAVGRSGSSESEYRYTHTNLRKDFPKLEKAQYVLRTLRRGWLYVYCEKDLECFKISERGEIGLEWGSKRKVAERATRFDRDALLFPEDVEEVMLAFSQHEWTGRQCNKLIKDESYRKTQMQKFSLTSSGQDAFPLNELGAQVEEYAGRGAEYEWTKVCPQKKYWTDARIKSLKATADKGQSVVALHDPLGIINDLGTLIEERIKLLEHYITAPDTSSSREHRERHRKKFIAEAIGRFYESRYAQNYYKKNRGAGNADADAKQLARLRQEGFRAEPANKGRRVPEVAELRRKLVLEEYMNEGIERFTKHVDETARQEFLSQYDMEVEAYQQLILLHKEDRAIWLETYYKNETSQDLGSALASYDLEDERNWLDYEVGFAHAIRGAMCVALPTDKMLNEAEAKLIGEWLAMSVDKSPLYRALLGYKKLREEIDVARDRFASTVDASASLIEGLYRKFPVNIATEEIVRNLFTYVLIKPKKLNGAAVSGVDNVIGRLINSNPKDAAIIENALMSRYGKFIKKETMTIDEFSRNMIDATRVPGVKQEIESLVRSGSLKTDKFTIIQVIDVTKRTTQNPFGTKYPNPFLGWGSSGVSAFVGLVNVVNTQSAIESFGINDEEQWWNTASAFASLGGALNGGLHNFSKTLPNSVGKFTKNNWLGRFLVGSLATRLFGYGGALFTGYTLGLRGKEKFQEKDTDAGMFYAAAVVTATVGNILLTEAAAAMLLGVATPIGIIVLGIVFVAASIMLENEALDAKDQAIEIWLDNCTFGRHQRKGHGVKLYATLKEETAAMVEALYSPVLASTKWDDRWGWDNYFTGLEIFVPGYDPQQSKLKVTAAVKDNVTFKDNVILLSNIESEPATGGRIFKYTHNPLKKRSTDGVRYHVSYTPSADFNTLELTVHLPKDKM